MVIHSPILAAFGKAHDAHDVSDVQHENDTSRALCALRIAVNGCVRGTRYQCYCVTHSIFIIY